MINKEKGGMGKALAGSISTITQGYAVPLIWRGNPEINGTVVSTKW